MSNNVNLAQVIALIKNMGGSGGTSDYSQLSNKPQIEGVELNGNKSLADLGYAIFYWNGQGSDKNPQAIDLWNKISETAKTQDVLVVMYSEPDDYAHGLAVVTNKHFGTRTNRTISVTTSVVKTYNSSYTDTNLNQYYHMIGNQQIITHIVFSDDYVSSVRDGNTTGSYTYYLDARATNDTIYFTPTKKSQPVSKGYLDEQIGTIVTLLDTLNGEVI